MPGDYTVPFEFDLAANLPSSVSFCSANDWHKGTIEYEIKATITNHDDTELCYKQMLVIH